jgi:hypothetical protein
MAHGGSGNTQLGTDLAQGPTLGVQVGCTLNVHRATVMIPPPPGRVGGRDEGRVKCDEPRSSLCSYELSAFERERLIHLERSGFVGTSRWTVDRDGRCTYMISRGDGPCPTVWESFLL